MLWRATAPSTPPAATSRQHRSGQHETARSSGRAARTAVPRTGCAAAWATTDRCPRSWCVRSRPSALLTENGRELLAAQAGQRKVRRLEGSRLLVLARCDQGVDGVQHGIGTALDGLDAMYV